jgi:hypothetical protein
MSWRPALPQEFIQRNRFTFCNFRIPLFKQGHARPTFGKVGLDLPVPCLRVLCVKPSYEGGFFRVWKLRDRFLDDFQCHAFTLLQSRASRKSLSRRRHRGGWPARCHFTHAKKRSHERKTILWERLLRRRLWRREAKRAAWKGGCSQDWLPHEGGIALTRGRGVTSLKGGFANPPQVC